MNGLIVYQLQQKESFYDREVSRIYHDIEFHDYEPEKELELYAELKSTLKKRREIKEKLKLAQRDLVKTNPKKDTLPYLLCKLTTEDLSSDFLPELVSDGTTEYIFKNIGSGKIVYTNNELELVECMKKCNTKHRVSQLRSYVKIMKSHGFYRDSRFMIKVNQPIAKYKITYGGILKFESNNIYEVRVFLRKLISPNMKITLKELNGVFRGDLFYGYKVFVEY